MRRATCKLSSVSPFSQSRYIQGKKPRDLTHEEWEEKSWKQRCHVDPEGIVYIPPMAFKNCIAEAAKYKSIQIPGKGKATYTKHFEAGILVVEPLSLGVHIDDVKGEWLHVPSDGKRGGSTRVLKCFPLFAKWSGNVEFLIFDETVNNEVFEQHLIDAGQFIGVGRFRPRNNGFYGRFSVDGIDFVKG